MEIQKNRDDNIIIQYVISIRKQEREIMYKRSTESKFSNKPGRFCEEDDLYLDRYCPLKISRCKGEKDEDLFITSDYSIFKRKLIYVVQRVWK